MIEDENNIKCKESSCLQLWVIDEAKTDMEYYCSSCPKREFIKKNVE